MNMIQLTNRPFAGKAPTTTQQAEFSIGWRFCPVCGNKLFQKIEGCSGILQVKCNSSVKILIDIAEYFHVSMDYLLLGRDPSRDQFQNELQAAIDHLEKIKGLL